MLNRVKSLWFNGSRDRRLAMWNPETRALYDRTGVYRESPVMADGIRRGGTGLAGGWGQVSRGGERRIVGRGPGWRLGGVDFLGLRGKEAGDTHLPQNPVEAGADDAGGDQAFLPPRCRPSQATQAGRIGVGQDLVQRVTSA